MTETIETPSVTATEIEKHSEAQKGNKNQKGGAKGKVIPASGEKLTGYGVQVMGGGKVLAEYFSEPSLKTQVGGAAN